MKSLFTIVAGIVSFCATAQLHISSGSYMYVRDQMVFVEQQIDLRSNANIFLRQNAQLLQGTSGNSTNTGVGEISIFQEGTVDNYEYNYWCSPIGNSSLAVGNESFGITMLERPVNEMTSTPAIMLSNTAYDGEAFPLKIAPRWINKFLSGASYSQWVPVYAASTIAPGQGFTMKGSSGFDVGMIYGISNNPGGKQRYDFRGKPNDGDINITVANGQFTLTGNPYPSAIDLSAFLTDALNCTGIAYFWEQDKTVNSHLMSAYRGGYGTFSPVSRMGSGIYVPAPFHAFSANGTMLGVQTTPMNSYARYFSPVGQGFLLEGNAAGTTVTMRNDYRVFVKENVSTSVFERNTASKTLVNGFLPEIQSVSGFDYTAVSTDPIPQIQFNALLDNSGFRQFVLAFDESATDGVDHAMDARSPGLNLPADVYFSIDNSEYVISVIDFDVTKRLPLGIKCTTDAAFQIAVSDIVNMPAVQDVYIYDKTTDVYHDIKNGVFEISLPAGNNTSRFEVTFTDQMLGNPTVSTSNFDILQDNALQQLSIRNPKMTDVKSVTIFDTAGKRIIEAKQIGAVESYSIPTSTFAEGVYIVKIDGEGTAMAQKISVFRGN